MTRRPSPALRFTGLLFVAHGVAAVTLALPAPSAAQESGSITGIILNAENLAPVIAASIELPDLGVGVQTDAAGRYLLSNVPAGTHRLRISQLGYLAHTETVSVRPGETTVLDFHLTASAIELSGIVVTGTAFPESQVDLPYSVTVTGRRSLEERGSPLTVDFIKSMSGSHGVIGEAPANFNGTNGIVPSNVASVNLRGLGPARTLVLLNSRRQVYAPVRVVGRFVDLNAIPSVAVERVEVLKEGASAVYGSDAIAGVVNFITRSEFEGFEGSASHSYFADAGDTKLGAIWGGQLGDAHVTVSGEWLHRQTLGTTERPRALQPYSPGVAGGWSYTGNPGAFLMPTLTGTEDKVGFISALAREHRAGGRVFVDPHCEEFGGYGQAATCRYSYMPWSNLINESSHFRFFAEANGELGERTRYRVEGLWADARVPAVLTSPSYPSIRIYDGIQLVSPENPGRRAFCAADWQSQGFADADACLADDWYFTGRMVGNSGPGRFLERSSRTQRLAASLEHDFEAFGDRDARLSFALGYSQSSNRHPWPVEYSYRRFLAFRGFGGPNCGVSVVPDPSSASGMALGPLKGAKAGEGSCMYYNPFSNAYEYSEYPGSDFEGRANPSYVADVANDPSLIDWILDEAMAENGADLFVADAMLAGTWIEDRLTYALGYQYRHLGVSLDPSFEANLNRNPCAVPEYAGCSDAEKTGLFTFTVGQRPYQATQAVHRVFAELPISLADGRFGAQVAANYESHSLASNFDPKIALRWRALGPLTLRASLQTTFRAPSVDNISEERASTVNFVRETGTWKAVDIYGSPDLDPERARTYNVGLGVAVDRARASVDYWHYDLEDMIGVFPQAAVTRLYAQGGAARDVVKSYVACPDGLGTGTCDPQQIERIRVSMINWPGIETSGIDVHLSSRWPAGEAVVSAGVDGTYTRSFFVKPLYLDDFEIRAGGESVGFLNKYQPVAPPLPRVKGRVSSGIQSNRYGLFVHGNYIGGYKDQSLENLDASNPVRHKFYDIGKFLTWDATFQWRGDRGAGLALSLLNITDVLAPLVNREQFLDPLTHHAKGRQVKLVATYELGR